MYRFQSHKALVVNANNKISLDVDTITNKVALNSKYHHSKGGKLIFHSQNGCFNYSD